MSALIVATLVIHSWQDWPRQICALAACRVWITNRRTRQDMGLNPNLGLGDGGGRTISPGPLESRFQPVRRRRIPIQSRSNAALRAPFYKA